MALFSDVLLTVDYDRTLTAPDSTVPQRNLEAIRYFMENGGAFTVNTGRSLPMTRAFREIVPVNAPLLLYNGSAAYDTREETLLFAHTIDLDPQQTIEKLLQLFPHLTVELQGLDAHYCFRHEPGWEAFSAHNHCACRFAQPEEDLGPFLKFSLYGQIRDVTVAGLYAATEEELREMDQAEEALRQHFGTHCDIFRPASRILDIHARGVSKARAARELQQKLGRRWLVCVGDGENDVSMLRAADFAYAPAGSVIADRFETVCNCADGAVAEVIYEKIPRILKK